MEKAKWYVVHTFSGYENKVKANIDKTICRKLTHISSAFIWVICYFFFGCSIHWVILNGISTVLMGFIIFNNKINIFARDDARKSVGLFYFCLSTFIVWTLSPTSNGM